MLTSGANMNSFPSGEQGARGCLLSRVEAGSIPARGASHFSRCFLAAASSEGEESDVNVAQQKLLGSLAPVANDLSEFTFGFAGPSSKSISTAMCWI